MNNFFIIAEQSEQFYSFIQYMNEKYYAGWEGDRGNGWYYCLKNGVPFCTKLRSHTEGLEEISLYSMDWKTGKELAILYEIY